MWSPDQQWAAASPGNSEMQILKPHPRQWNQEGWGWALHTGWRIRSLPGDSAGPSGLGTSAACCKRCSLTGPTPFRIPFQVTCTLRVSSGVRYTHVFHLYNDPSKQTGCPHFTDEKTSSGKLKDSTKVTHHTYLVRGRLDLEPRSVCSQRGQEENIHSHTHPPQSQKQMTELG